MILYIAGKMSGFPDMGRARFREAEERLRQRGHVVLNPAALPIGLPPDRYMPICLAMIDASEGIYLLDGWRASRGATIEAEYARYQGKQVLYEACEVAE